MLVKKSSLQGQALSGSIWILSLIIFTKAMGIIRLIVVARLLSPTEFGLFGVAMLFYFIVETLTETGFRSALIQKKKTLDYLDSAWTVQLCRGLFLFLLVLFSAPLIGQFFNDARVVQLVQVLSIVFLLKGLSNIGTIFFTKHLAFNKYFILEFTSVIVELIVSIVAVFILQSVWALILGLLAKQIAHLILSYQLHDFRPRFHANLREIREIVDFGKWIFGTNILMFISNFGDKLIVAKMLGTTWLGFYVMGSRWNSIITKEFPKLVNLIAFPAYAKRQEHIKNLRDGFLNTLESISLILFPSTVLLVYLANDLIMLALGERWLPVTQPLQLLAIAGVMRALEATAGALFNGVGKPKLNFLMNVIRVIFLLIVIFPLTIIYGISGTAASILVGSLAIFPYWLISASRTVEVRVTEVLGIFLAPLIMAFMMIMTMIIFKAVYPGKGGILMLLLSILLGMATYVSAGYIAKKYCNKNFIITTLLYNRLLDVRSQMMDWSFFK